MIKKILLLLSIVVLSFSCQVYKKSDTVTYTINSEVSYQTIDNFGASDCWSCQYIGKNWDLEKRQQIAEWLFSTELDKTGQPKGIGISAWRFNIGAGSKEQGKAGRISKLWRRSECFLNQDGSYNFNKQAGQQWFIQQAKSYGIDQFIAFVNSPPVMFTKNGIANGCGATTYNLRKDKYDNFADFLTKVIIHFRDKEGIEFNYLSPANEPQWNWGDDNLSQEGTACTNAEYSEIVKSINKAFQTKNINTKIQLSDCAQIDYLYLDNTSRPSRDNQIIDFFSPESSNYIGDLSTVDPTITAHSYFTTWPVESMIAKRQLLKSELDKTKLKYWQSEYCLLENNPEIKGGGRDLGINTALYVARLIHFDLTLTNASAWQWWLAVSPYNYKDGLVYTDNDTINGEIYDSKLLWAMGNFSRFIRPGMQRIKITSSTPKPLTEQASELMTSAFQDKNQTVIVTINYSNNTKEIKIMGKGKTYTPYITSDIPNDNLRPLSKIKSGKTITIPGRSIVTFVSNYKK